MLQEVAKSVGFRRSRDRREIAGDAVTSHPLSGVSKS
jgi:hypothetical protein